MSYFVVRGQSQYGPYSLADLERYVASGDIQLADLAQGEGMAGTLPVSQILGLGHAPAPPPSVPYAHTSALTAGPHTQLPALSYYPDPPSLHWGLVLLFGVFTCGLFLFLWEVIQAAWVRKVEPRSKALIYYFLYIFAWISFIFLVYAMRVGSGAALTMNLLCLVLFFVARYSLRASLVTHFNMVEPMDLLLGGVMTFFFGGLYFQYHLSNIVLRKQMARARGF